MNISTLVTSAALGIALTLSACASGPGRALSGYGAELERLATDCRERGGILSPIDGATTGRPQTDYACQIRGGASRISPAREGGA